MEASEKIRSKIRQASFESQAIYEKVKRMDLPDNVKSWIDDANSFANNLPDNLEQKKFILRYASFAVNSLGNEQKLKEYLYQIKNNIVNAKHDISLMKQYSGAKKGGSRSKHKVWADLVSDWLLENVDHLTESQVWDQIPDSTNQQESEDEYDYFKFYKDGDDLVKTQHGLEDKLKKSTFFKNYYSRLSIYNV